MPEAVAALAASQSGPAEPRDLPYGMAAISASPSSVARVGGHMVDEIALEPAVDTIGGNQDTGLKIVRIAPRRNCGTELARGIQDVQDGAVERPAVGGLGGLGGLVAQGFHRRQAQMDVLPVCSRRKDRDQPGSGRLADQADFLYGQQQRAVDCAGLYARKAGSEPGSTGNMGRSSFKDKLVNIDFTVIDLNLSMDDSAKHQINETRGGGQTWTELTTLRRQWTEGSLLASTSRKVVRGFIPFT
jgi:hypothetical protein